MIKLNINIISCVKIYLNKIKKIVIKLKIKLLYYRLRKKNIYYVISTGRTGTNFMENFLNLASEDVFCVHEPQPDYFDISINKIRIKKPQSILHEEIKKARFNILTNFSKERKSIFIESNPFATFLIPELNQVFPNAKFIFIYRDIYTYLLSALNKSPLANGINNFYAESDGRKRPRPSDFEDDNYTKEWPYLSRAQKITWYWKKCNEYLINFAQENKLKVLNLKFEDLFSNDVAVKKATLCELFSFTGIDVNEKQLIGLLERSKDKKNQTREKFYSSLDDLSQSEIDWIDDHTSKLRMLLNY